jgi:translation initiation factor IF-3
MLSSKSGNFSAFFSQKSFVKVALNLFRGRQSEKSSLTMSLPLAQAKNGDKQFWK